MANEFFLTTLAQICSKGKAALAYVVGWVDIFSKKEGRRYIYASARDYYCGKECGLLKNEFLMETALNCPELQTQDN